MSITTKTLLKNGLTALAHLEEEYFKENITHALAFKLNDAIDDAYKTATETILHKTAITETSEELNKFLQFVENFESGKYQFKNNSELNIVESDVDALKNLFEALNVKNRQKMVEEIFNDSDIFKQHVEFYNQAKGLLK
jgi:alcohol dehydrogenase YqhD (iron-dependent ADH family)